MISKPVCVCLRVLAYLLHCGLGSGRGEIKWRHGYRAVSPRRRESLRVPVTHAIGQPIGWLIGRCLGGIDPPLQPGPA